MFLGKKLPQGWLTGWGSTLECSAPLVDATRNRLSHFLAVPWNNYSIPKDWVFVNSFFKSYLFHNCPGGLGEINSPIIYLALL